MEGLTRDQERAIEQTMIEISLCPGGWYHTTPEMARSWTGKEE